MTTSGFTLRQLEYFDAVASEGSLSAAATRCHVTPSALTLAIDDLERHLDVQLLVRRKGRGVVLTPAGTRMLVHARGVLGRVEALADEASMVASSVSGRFAVGCFTTLTPFFMPPIVQSFRRDHPQVDIEFTTGPADELHAQLMQGRLDSAVLYSADVPASLSFDPVREYRPYVLVAASHPFAQRRAVSLAEMVDDPLLLLDVPPTLQNTNRMFEALDLSPTLGDASSSYETVRCLVAAGLGYSVLFQRPATLNTYSGRDVRILEIADPVRPAVVGLALPRGAPHTARYRALRSSLLGG